MKLLFPLLLTLQSAASLAQSQLPAPHRPSGVPSPKTTEVMVILTAKQGVNRQQFIGVMPAEIRATVKLYLDGEIRQWYIPVGPLLPLAGLIGDGRAPQ